MQHRLIQRGGFALPTVLIASVVMLIILTVSVSSVSAIRTALKAQYYEQLAQVAGEAGVAYAKACLAKNGNTPQWTNAKPLKPNTDCAGNALAGITCPADERCAVMVNGNIRSSFSVNAPTVNAQGKAITIPNNGFVELLRESNGQVWRTFKQPSVQSVAVPDLCSGASTSALGWTTAVAAAPANQRTIPGFAGAEAATTISLSAGVVPAGQTYFRRDFYVPNAGWHELSVLTNNSNDRVRVTIDQGISATSEGTKGTVLAELGVGCHTLTAQLTNKTISPSYSQFTAALKYSGSVGSAPVVTTDLGWRVSAGSTVSFSDTAYYADPDIWIPVKMHQTTHAQLGNADWSSGGDVFTPMISPNTSGCPSSCPGNATIHLRDSKDFYLASDTLVTGALMCDNACDLYIDGERVLRQTSLTWTDISRQSFTLSAGYHRAGIVLYNSGTTANPAGVAMSLVPSGGGAAIARTDTTWTSANSWTSGGLAGNVVGYEKTFIPSPKVFTDALRVDVLVVGGGGGGGRNAAGGGGGGGVYFAEGTLLAAQTTYSVTVGSGGAGSTSTSVAGGSGGASVFGTRTINGGGGGASRDGGTAALSGGSGGGGAGANSTVRNPGGAGIFGLGNTGGAGTTADAGAGSTGGGGGGAGGTGMYGVANGSSGNGGAGAIFYLDEARLSVGNGGAGGITTTAGTGGFGPDGGGNGGTTTSWGYPGVANTGSGGGGGGSGGGGGGSGIVVIRIKTGLASITTSPVITPTTTIIDGVSYTIYKFTSSGTFRVNSVTAT